MVSLIDVLHARAGLVCAVGAGGKKSTLVRLARAHSGRVLFTSTTMIGPLRDDVPGARVVATEDAVRDRVAEAARGHRLIAAIGPHVKAGRHAGFAEATIESLRAAAGADLTLVKADGARMRLIKAPGDAEPVLPRTMTTLIPVVSAAVIGEPLTDRIAHRIERLTAVTGAQMGDILTPENLGRLLAHPEGSLKGCADAVVVPVINMVDDPSRVAAARAAAMIALRLTNRFDTVVLASMVAEDPIVALVRR